MKLYQNCLAVAVLSFVSASALAFGPGNMPTVPSGWTLKENYGNILVYQKLSESSYMQIVDIKSGGRLSFFNSFPSGNSPYQFDLNWMDTWWGMLANKKTMVNGQFFAYYPANPFPTTLSFGVKASGSLLTPGADNGAYPSTSLRQIEITNGVGASVYSWNSSRLNTGVVAAQNILVGLHPSPTVVTNKDPNNAIGRMMICTKPQSGAAWVYILSAGNLTQQTALNYSISWGCATSSTIMMDGSGSAQLRTVNSGTLLAGDRRLPQVIAVYNQ